MTEKPDIIQVAQALNCLPEKKSGNRYQGGSCPAGHESKHGRCWTVYEDTQSCYCYDCHIGGDVFELIKAALKCDFKDTLHWAEENGLLSGNGYNEAHYQELRKVHQILTDTAIFFHSNLKDSSHLKQHYGLSEETIQQYLIGFAPLDKHALKKHLEDKGHDIADIRKTGLLGKYDDSFFQGQYILPYWHNGLVKYFIGRQTPETPDWKHSKYDKLPVYDIVNNDVFYGEDSIRGKDVVYVTEGVTDCLAALQHSLPSISPVTTQFRKADHPKLLSLVKGKSVFLIPDNEENEAGMKGAQETLAFLKNNGVEVCIITLPRPAGQEKIDFNEYVRDQGIKAFHRLVEQQTPPGIADLICDVSQFISIEFPEKQNIIHPWLSESSIDMVYGPRGVGKTMFIFGVLCAATTGEPFGAWQVNTPVPSLYLDGEMAPQDTQNRLNRFPSLKKPGRQPLIIYCDAQMNQHGLPRANLLDDEWRKRMKQILLANDIKLWVADNIASLAPGTDENSKQEWDPVNQWFLELRFAGITTIFLHHANKDGGQRGTSGREDNIDISILLDKPKTYVPEDGARFVVKFQKARIEQKYLSLITDTEFSLETDEKDNYLWTYGMVKKQHKTQVLTMLDEGMKARDVAMELGINESRVSQIKSEAIKDGLITEKGKITPSGLHYVQKTKVRAKVGAKI